MVLSSLCLWAVADSGYLLRIAKGSYQVGTVLDAGWIVAIVGLAWGQRVPRTAQDAERPTHGRAVWVPVFFIGAALCVFAPLVVTKVSVVGALALGAALLCAGLRMVATLKQVERLVGIERELEARRGTERLSSIILHSSDAILLVDANAKFHSLAPPFIRSSDMTRNRQSARVFWIGSSRRIAPVWFANWTTSRTLAPATWYRSRDGKPHARASKFGSKARHAISLVTTTSTRSFSRSETGPLVVPSKSSWNERHSMTT